MLFTRSILDDRLSQGALRLSVMSRHTCNDGLTPDLRLVGRFDEHRPILGPSPKLVGDYYRRTISWLDFRSAYLLELKQEGKSQAVEALIALARERDVVILCVEEHPLYCHRRLLAEECQRRCPILLIDVG